MTGAESQVQQDRAPDLVRRLQRAAALLRAVDHDHPRGPWRSAHPEPTGQAEDLETPPRSGVEDALRSRNPTARAAHEPWSVDRSVDPLAAFEDLVGGNRPLTVHRPAVDPSLAGPLADLLDAVAELAVTTLAERSDDDEAALAATEPYRSAVAVAERVRAAET